MQFRCRLQTQVNAGPGSQRSARQVQVLRQDCRQVQVSQRAGGEEGIWRRVRVREMGRGEPAEGGRAGQKCKAGQVYEMGKPTDMENHGAMHFDVSVFGSFRRGVRESIMPRFTRCEAWFHRPQQV